VGSFETSQLTQQTTESSKDKKLIDLSVPAASGRIRNFRGSCPRQQMEKKRKASWMRNPSSKPLPPKPGKSSVLICTSRCTPRSPQGVPLQKKKEKREN